MLFMVQIKYFDWPLIQKCRMKLENGDEFNVVLLKT